MRAAVLLVDDNSGLRRKARRWLEAGGCGVRGGGGGWRLGHRGGSLPPPAVVLLGIELPEMSG